MKQPILVLVLLGLSLSLYSQFGSVSGAIIDETEAPVSFANVLLLNATDSSLVKGDYSDDNGQYSFDRLTQGEYIISADLIGYNAATSAAFTIEDNHKTIELLHLSQGVELDQITISARKPFIEMEADKIIVNIENSSINAGNSALEVLAKSPGVIVDKDNNISLRGRQGVLVTIDGKQQYMSSAEVASMLESMPAENIKRIEIIANPSAKFDAEGNSGVINIQLKKNENLGLNGQFNAGARQGQRFTWNSGLNLNYRSEKMNVYGGGSIYNRGQIQALDLYRSIPYNSGVTTFDQSTLMDYTGTDLNGRFGVDYFISDKTTLGVLAKIRTDSNAEVFDNNTLIEGDNAPVYNRLNVDSDLKGALIQQSYNVNLVHRFNDKGTQIVFDADYSMFSKNGLNDYVSNYADDEGNEVQSPFMLFNETNTSIDIFAAKADFNHSFSNGIKLDVGTKYSSVTTDNDTEFEAFEEGQWLNQEDRTNQFVYNENVFAMYINGAKSLGKVQLQAGLRMEHTLSEGNSITLNQVVPRQYTDFFPSVSISHMIGEKHSLSYNYSKRLNRPSYHALNPFIGYLDEYTFNKGNPFLNPQYSDAFGVNYGLGRSLFISANYSFTKDNITEVIEQISDSNLTYQTSQNLENFHSASLTVSVPKVWNEWWTTRLNATSFYHGFISEIPSGTLNNHNVAGQFFLSNNFIVPGGWNIDLNANYRTGLVYGLFAVEAQYGIDLGVSKSIMNGNGNVKFGIDDVLNSRRNDVTIQQDDIYLIVRNKQDTRRVKLSFTYNFGNKKIKAARNRRTATEDENRRAN